MSLTPRENVPLAPLTTLGVGGPARFYVAATTEDDVRRAIAWARERDRPWIALGGGSNVVVADEGFDGLVLHLDLRDVRTRDDHDVVLVTAAAGEPWDDLVAQTVARGWTGMEALSGIPGRVGATPIQNVGAYGQEVAEIVREVRTFDTETGDVCTFSPQACAFAYRDSRFKREPGRHIVLAVTFALRRDAAPRVRYAELQRALSTQGDGPPTVADVRRTVLDVRRRKSMVVDEADPNSRSVGSFFVNPVVDAGHYGRVVEAARRNGAVAADEEPPHFDAVGGVKLSAAWLIERAGFARGLQRGRVGLSQNHALAIINRGGATAADIVSLVTEIRAGVDVRFGVRLQPEPVFVGSSTLS